MEILHMQPEIVIKIGGIMMKRMDTSHKKVQYEVLLLKQ